MLLLDPTPEGIRCRFVINTTSWFDMVSRQELKRPDMESLRRRFEELERAAGGDARASDDPSVAPRSCDLSRDREGAVRP